MAKTKVEWKPAETAPLEAFNLLIYATVTCQCGRGAKVTLPAGRMQGQWVIDFGHSIEITHWMKLPAPPEVMH